jgi:hypothetical protein
LTNFALKALPARFEVPKESRFDLFIDNWKGRRGLLVEAKTESRGALGRTQVRLAIGQLYDYRELFFADRKQQIDLALLLAHEPADDIKTLLGALKIHILWPDGFRLSGTTGPLR